MDNRNIILNSIIINVAIFATLIGLLIIMKPVVGGNMLRL